MTYNEFCSRPENLKSRIEHQIDDVNFKWNLCQNITASLEEKVQTSPSNYTEKSYLSYIESKRKLDALYDDLETAETELRDFLYSNLEPDLADVLEWKYIGCKTAQEIANIKRLTYQSAKNKISKADRKSERCYKNVTKCY